ncbi:hypothetical protein MAIT1_01524 [Magnetofaba australis IT-1]|uniref:Uncharacterized protein n=1 Tax=Magnetofaba australis IT-1 TaxID=1434232 RepID=A0A1Y2K0H9_9PROT|nr:hypothetical protein MAIT1_01524 [Magnetofaba australis IT-1]
MKSLLDEMASRMDAADIQAMQSMLGGALPEAAPRGLDLTAISRQLTQALESGREQTAPADYRAWRLRLHDFQAAALRLQQLSGDGRNA